LMFTTVFTSSCALILWVILFKPDLADLIVMVPADSVPVIICVGLLFSTGNAIWEEIIFRGILWNGLQKAYGNIIVLVVFQAVLFSLLHIGGFPRGAVGVILAGVYGAAIGVIRMFSKGLAAPVITHFFADATIFGILVAMKI
jgi:membrane protease YdiL (CAAX protease family)